MQKKRLIILYSAAGAVALAMAFAVSNMMGSKPEPKKVVVPKGSVEVLVAAKNIRVGELLSMKKLKWKHWPKSALLPGMIKATKGGKEVAKRIAMARTIVPLLPGEPILEGKLLFPEDGSYLSSVLAPGMRAIAIPVTMVRTAGGYVRPYDRVDLLYIGRDGDPDKAELVLENVKVLAINKVVVGSKEKSKKNNGPRPLKAATRAVLELTLPQARLLTKLTRQGRIYMALRSLADKSVAGEPKLVGRFVDLAKEGGPEEILSDDLKIIIRGVSSVRTW